MTERQDTDKAAKRDGETQGISETTGVTIRESRVLSVFEICEGKRRRRFFRSLAAALLSHHDTHHVALS
jgi:hypothetical protein